MGKRDNEHPWQTDAEHFAKLAPQARRMRAEPTPAEDVLWQLLRLGHLGLHFRRQHCIGPFIVDFCCARAHLAVELDGRGHLEEREYDQARTEYLNGRGVEVVRFRNERVMADPEGVAAEIWRRARERIAERKGSG